jgi:sugar phosphate isomerase/epimerase
MKKVNFLQNLLLLTVIVLILATLVSCEKSAPKKNIGLQLYSLRDSIFKNVPGTLERVGKMGYTFVEAAGYRDGKFYGMEPVEFKNLCEANGLKFLGSHTGRDLPDSSNLEETIAWWDQCIEAHAAAGVKWIVQPFMGKVGYESLDGLKKYCNYFNMVGEKCQNKGILFGYHNHDKEFSTQLDSMVIYDFMLQNTDPAKVMFQIDLYWCVIGGKNPVDYFTNYPGRFTLWHIKDETEIGGADTKVNFEVIWPLAAKSGMKYGIVEVERYNFEPFESCKKSLDFLNNASFVVMPQN